MGDSYRTGNKHIRGIGSLGIGLGALFMGSPVTALLSGLTATYYGWKAFRSNPPVYRVYDAMRKTIAGIEARKSQANQNNPAT